MEGERPKKEAASIKAELSRCERLQGASARSTVCKVDGHCFLIGAFVLLPYSPTLQLISHQSPCAAYRLSVATVLACFPYLLEWALFRLFSSPLPSPLSPFLHLQASPVASLQCGGWH